MRGVADIELIKSPGRAEKDAVILTELPFQPNKAGLILPDNIDENEDITMLVMPVMLNDYD